MRRSLITIFDDPEALGRGAAELFVRLAREAVAARGRFSAALAGGGTPRRTYELLGQPPYCTAVDWPRVDLFWGDERCVAWDDPRSNARMAYHAWLNHVPLPRSQIHPIDCTQAPAGAARRYEQLLREFFGGGEPSFDLILLGLGEDGHTASLFPGEAALTETERWVAPVYQQEPNPHRLTFTAAFINQARVVAFLAAGAAKAKVVREVIQGPREPQRLPAQLIRPEPGELHWLLDKAAAGAMEPPGAG